MASYYLKLRELSKLLRIGDLLIRENAGAKLGGPMKHQLCSIATSPTYCSDVSMRRKWTNCVPETSGSSYFSTQIKTVKSHTPGNKISRYTSCGNSFIFKSFSNKFMSARLITFSEMLKLCSHSQDICRTSSVVKVAAIANTSWLCNSLIPVRTFHSGRIQEYSQNRSTNLAAGIRCCYSSGTVSSEPKNKANEEKNNQMKTHLSNLVYNLFSGRYNYGLLHKSVILENGLFGKTKTSVGVLSYAIALLKLRLRVHGQFTGTYVEIANVSFMEDGVIRIQWHFKAVSQTSLLKALKFIALDADHLDVCSYFHVDESGLVKKHRIEKASGYYNVNKTQHILFSGLHPANGSSFRMNNREEQDGDDNLLTVEYL